MRGSTQKRGRTTRIGLVVVAILATGLVTLAILNLSTSEKRIDHRVESLYGAGDPQFLRSMGSLLGPGVLGGNRVETLVNGEHIFPAMLDAIRHAEKSVDFETYIYWSGAVGRSFSEALIERARNGVKVHVLLDWAGSSKMDDAQVEAMRAAGARVVKYHPLRWFDLARVNNRTHRKLLIVDGRVGFTGGVGIADKWDGRAQDADHWRDTHYRIEGPAVAQMQAAFMDNWMKTEAEVLHGAEYFPALEDVGGVSAQVFKSSPREGSESVRLMYLLSIAAARRSIYLENAYFVPDDLAVGALVSARKRGVTVRVIVPGPIIDTSVVRRASRSRWGPLLEAGVEIYEYQPTMFHCKLVVIDEVWTSVGSTNFDNRSFRLNDEANLNVWDPAFAREQLGIFTDDLAKSRRVTLAEWRARPFREKAGEWLAGFLRQQL